MPIRLVTTQTLKITHWPPFLRCSTRSVDMRKACSLSATWGVAAHWTEDGQGSSGWRGHTALFRYPIRVGPSGIPIQRGRNPRGEPRGFRYRDILLGGSLLVGWFVRSFVDDGRGLSRALFRISIFF